MVTSADAGYSSNWVSESGLDLEEGYCITLARGVRPREALHRLGVSDAAIRAATWPEFTAELREPEPAHVSHGVVAAFVMGEHVVLVEDVGYRGRSPEWAGSVSRGTEAVNVYLSPTSLKEELSIFRDGQQVASIDGDEPEVVEGGDAELAGRLVELTYDALKPLDEDDEAPEDLSDGRVDLLQVACDYFGLQPEAPDISGPVLGALVEYR
ncbi:DUF6461 domain-containing protein [Saccharopolyspora sp. NFXS83]|uniref:DUF6461 domain-containing protein n=1 Tax=Saccharopolyspora sp. NFXS83 TaxID=2993560 RepID=UPI00224AE6A3|nr:DUF6461 domain-containing protein [Saccharopolyspora sp. NFXS83]MCX2728953.1 DUF6461 domain-containing protein [Saccharopolyspora sp. NFXS83]